MDKRRAAATPFVPFRSLRPVHDPVKNRILADIAEMFDTDSFTNGPQVEAFEQAYAAYCRTRFCVGVSSGIDALRLSLLAAGIEPGDQVIAPANSFIATYAAIRQAGGRPVLVDVTAEDYNIDADGAEAAVTERTRCLLPVHLYGQMADLRRLEPVARTHGLVLVEDAAQAHGAERDGARAGSVGRAGCFSFWPGKNLGGIGDAGAVVTSDEELAERVRALREHGQRVRGQYDYEGYTARLDTVQAIALLHKLPLLDGWNAQRRAAATFYADALAGVGDVRLPPVASRSSHVWHLYPLLSDSRCDRIREVFAERGIGTGRHAPQPPHLAPAFAWLGYARGAFPLTERLAERSTLLPLFPGISEGQQQAVVDAVIDAFSRG